MITRDRRVLHRLCHILAAPRESLRFFSGGSAPRHERCRGPPVSCLSSHRIYAANPGAPDVVDLGPGLRRTGPATEPAGTGPAPSACPALGWRRSVERSVDFRTGFAVGQTAAGVG